MSKDHKLDDAELANVSGSGGQVEASRTDEQKPGDGTNLDDATQQDDVGGGLTDPNLG